MDSTEENGLLGGDGQKALKSAYIEAAIIIAGYIDMLGYRVL